MRLERAEQSRCRRQSHAMRDYLRIYRGRRRGRPRHSSRRTPAAARVKIGGPAIDGTQRAYWLDWIAQLVSDVDDRHARRSSTGTCTPTGGRRSRCEPVNVKLVDDPDSPDGSIFEALTMAQTPQYEARARSVGRLHRRPRHPQRLRRAEHHRPPRASTSRRVSTATSLARPTMPRRSST